MFSDKKEFQEMPNFVFLQMIKDKYLREDVVMELLKD